MREVTIIRCAILVAASVVTGSCGAATSRPPATPTAPAAAPAPARHTHENLNATLWMQTSVEYRASTLQTYHGARLALDAALADRHETAALEQTADPSSLPPAIVLDLDETVLDNSVFQARQVKDDSGYSDAAWDAWCREEKAGAVPGAVEFLRYAKSRGVTPIYVTNRGASVEQATRHVLARLDIPVDPSTDVVLTRHEQGWDSSDKGARRAFVAARYRILLLVGDNFEDFLSVPRGQQSLAGRAALMDKYADYFGSKWIVLPNPTYGSWEQAITLGGSPGDDQTALARKYAALTLAR